MRVLAARAPCPPRRGTRSQEMEIAARLAASRHLASPLSPRPSRRRRGIGESP